MTLHCSDLDWNELISMPARLAGKDLGNWSINIIDYFKYHVKIVF